MTVTAKLYGPALLSAFNKEIDFDSDTVKIMLCTSSYTPDQDTHRYKSSVTNEVSGTGYPAGGATLSSKVASYDSSTNTVKLDAADVSFTGSTIIARYAVIYVDTGSSATSPLIAYVDFGANVVTSSGTFLIQFDANGLVNVSAA